MSTQNKSITLLTEEKRMYYPEKPTCLKCQTTLTFRRWSNRLPKKTEALADCKQCGEKYQIRYWNGHRTSEPYQVKTTAKKTCRGSYKVHPDRKAAIVALYGSVQNFLDTCPLVSMSLQYKS